MKNRSYIILYIFIFFVISGSSNSNAEEKYDLSQYDFSGLDQNLNKDNFDDLDFSGVVDIPEGYNKNLLPKSKDIVPYVCIGVPLSDKKKFLSQSRHMQEALCKAYKATNESLGITDSDIRQREIREKREREEEIELEMALQELKREQEQDEDERQLYKGLLNASKKIGSAIAGSNNNSYMKQNSSSVSSEPSYEYKSSSFNHPVSAEIVKFKQVESNSYFGNCGPKPPAKPGYKIGRCVSGHWEQISKHTMIHANCGPKPPAKPGYKIGRCVSGQWEQISKHTMIHANCGPKPPAKPGYKIGRCVSGQWEQISK